MRTLNLRSLFGLVVFIATWPSFCAASLVIQLDYSDDNTLFFTNNTVAKAALEAAALDIQNAITTSLVAMPTDTFTGNSGGASITFQWEFTYTNPTTNTPVTLTNLTLPVDTVRIFVGVQNLGGSTLGQGGPGSSGFFGSGGGAGDFPGAVDAAEAASNAALGRSGGPAVAGPTFATFNGNFGLPNTDFVLNVGPTIGNLWFDVDSNNDTITDSALQLDAYWHFDHTSSVDPTKNDFYSVALHEILHALGMGTSDNWDDLANGTTWDGPEAQALNGNSGLNLVNGPPDGAHIAADSVFSPRITDAVLQEVVMDPSITVGTRKFLTQMDLAFLRDIGWTTINPTPVPEPGTNALLVVALAGAGLWWRRRTRSQDASPAQAA